MKIELPQFSEKQIYFLFIILALGCFDGILLLKHFTGHAYYQDFNYALYAYTYQKCGYVTRGLIPSILELLHCKDPFVFVIIFNVLVIAYTSLFVYVSRPLENTIRILFLLSVTVLFFGPLHYALDLFKFDLFIVVLILLGYICLGKNKWILFWLIYVLALLIHDAAYFLFLPVAVLLVNGMKNKFLYAGGLTCLFVIAVIFAKPIPAEVCAQLIIDYTGVKDVPYVWYGQKTLSLSKNLPYFFSVINVPLLVIGLCIYILGNFFAFPALWKGKFSLFKYSFLFPLLLCGISIDWYRWICFFYVITLLYALNLDAFRKRSFIVLTNLTAFMGIPVFISLKFSLFNKLLYLLFH